MRRRLPAFAARALLVVLLVAGAACGGDGEGSDPEAAPDDAAAALASVMPVVDDQRAVDSDDGLVLEWEPVAGATEYAVTVAHDDGVAWTWVGTQTRVRYGSLPSVPGDDEPTEAVDPDLDLAIAVDSGRDHRWFVTAFGTDDEVLAVGPIVDLVVSG